MRLIILIVTTLVCGNLKSQTIQSNIPDSILRKFECNKLYKLIDASRNKFKQVRGARKAVKYSEVYASTLNPKYIRSGQIAVEGRAVQYQAFLAEKCSRSEAAAQYSKIVAVVENCLEGWIILTEPEDEEQLFRFKAHEKEDMISGVSVEIILYKSKGSYFVEFLIQP